MACVMRRDLDAVLELQAGLFDDAVPGTAPEVGVTRRVAARLLRADLSFAELTNADLSFANLDATRLFAANLRGADLRFCVLNEADLSFASLHEAKLDPHTLMDGKWQTVWEIVNQGAVGRNLQRADLSFSDISEADLRRAERTTARLWPLGSRAGV